MHSGGVSDACHSTAEGSAVRDPSAPETRTTGGGSRCGCGFLRTRDGVCPKLWIWASAASRRRGSLGSAGGVEGAAAEGRGGGIGR